MAVSGYFIRRTVAQNESGVASSVAGLASLSLADGQVVATTGYYSGGDGGANTYIYHGTGRPTADGGFYINGPGPDDYFEAINKTEINVRQFGARGDVPTINHIFNLQLIPRYRKSNVLCISRLELMTLTRRLILILTPHSQ